MNKSLKEMAMRYGDRLQVIDVKHLEDLQKEINMLQQKEELNGFQKWIVNDLYDFQIPKTDFPVLSIILMAVHHPMSTDVIFNYEGKSYEAKAIEAADLNRASEYLSEELTNCGYHAQEVTNLPMKRLAVQGGLAAYGRNNITYVEGLGSNAAYIAFFSDVPCEEDIWVEAKMHEHCKECRLCIELCPTHAIREERFLIDNEKCLSFINEGGGEFPDWLPKEVHHTVYDCLRCQEQCPLNASVIEDTIDTISFSEEETRMLLQGKGPEDFSQEFLKRIEKINLFYWKDGLSRNIRAIIEK
jgi:epoxyqueuosine reductase